VFEALPKVIEASLETIEAQQKDILVAQDVFDDAQNVFEAANEVIEAEQKVIEAANDISALIHVRLDDAIEPRTATSLFVFHEQYIKRRDAALLFICFDFSYYFRKSVVP